MDNILLYKTAMLAGEIMAQSGAETFRVEDTMHRILRTSHFQTVEVHATTTGIMATLSDPASEPVTGVKRISNRSNNLNRIDEVNQISRDLCDKKVELKEAYEKLLEVKDRRIYSKTAIALATVVAAFGSAGFFGGNIADCLVAAVNGCFIAVISILSRQRVGSAFMSDAVKSFILAVITMTGAHFFGGLHPEIVIIGSIMPLVPGIPITNAIRDTLQGDYMSGMARAAEAFVISLGIAVGVGFGMGFFNMLSAN